MQFIDAFIQFSIHPVSISSCSSCHLNLLHYCCWRYALLFELQDFILFTWMHLEDAFIQSDLALKRIWSVLACPGIWTYDLGIAI